MWISDDSEEVGLSCRLTKKMSKKKILVLLDIEPDAKMMDEGIARKVINIVQTLRKHGKLVPIDNLLTMNSITSPQGS